MTDDKDRFVRWNQLTISERGKAINLFLTLSLATIGFVVTLLLKDNFEFKKCFAKLSILTGTSLLLIDVVILLSLILNRLKGFSNTAKKIRAEDEQEKELLTETNTATDKRTLLLFKISTWVFGIGEILVVVGFLAHILYKL
jgi:hypothetical protein